MKWIYATAIIVAISIMGYVFITLETSEAVPVQVIDTQKRTIPIIHAFKDGEHRFIGQVRLPNSCYAIDAEAVHNPKNSQDITIVIVAKDRELDQSQCAKIVTNYPFEILAEAPEEISVHATINDEPFLVALTETAWQSGVGNYINPNTK